MRELLLLLFFPVEKQQPFNTDITFKFKWEFLRINLNQNQL